MAAVLRSTVGLALRRASRLSSSAGGPTPASTRVRTMYTGGQHGGFDDGPPGGWPDVCFYFIALVGIGAFTYAIDRVGPPGLVGSRGGRIGGRGR